MEQFNPRARSDAYGSRINRDHYRTLAYSMPWVSIMVGSVLPIFPITAAIPLVPPLGFLMLLSWRMLRPGLLPVWAGFPLGMFDDLFSGQPFGSAIALWSLAMLAVEAIETRFPWRSFMLDWATAGTLLVSYIVAGAVFSGADLTGPMVLALLPQLVVSIVLFPAISRVVARLDRYRLMRAKVIR